MIYSAVVRGVWRCDSMLSRLLQEELVLNIPQWDLGTQQEPGEEHDKNNNAAKPPLSGRQSTSAQIVSAFSSNCIKWWLTGILVKLRHDKILNYFSKHEKNIKLYSILMLGSFLYNCLTLMDKQCGVYIVTFRDKIFN